MVVPSPSLYRFRTMTRVPLLAVVVGLLMAPVAVRAQGANAKVARCSPTAKKLPV
jgi:hypothetical protein